MKVSNTSLRAFRAAVLCGVASGALLMPTMGFAQSAEGASGDSGKSATIEEVIVTARKRAESIMATPVIMQAITAQEVQDKRITDTAQLAQVTPNLNIHYTGGIVGANVNFRGLNNGFASTIEQSMQLVIDGASTSSGQFYMTGFFDVGQIEVLKGPQSLFYGKGASAGIISVRSAGPTPQWETKLTAGYEFNADEFVTDGYVSGPITPDLGIRVAATYGTMKGYFVNPNPANPHHRVPDEDRWGGRVVLKYNPGGGPLTAEINYSQFYVKGHSNNQYLSQKLCTGPRPQNPALIYDNCKLDKYLQGNLLVPPFNPALLTNAFSPGFATGSGLVLAKNGDGMESQTNLAVGSIDYEIKPGLTFSSLTSVSRFTTDYRAADYFGALPYRISAWQRNKEFSQEARLTSDFHDSWINFMAGAYYNSGTSASRAGFELPALPTPGVGLIGLVTDNDQVIKSRTKAVFGQLLLTPVKHFELALGVRRTHARKYITSLFVRNNYPVFFVPGPTGENINLIPEAARNYSENNTSPEVTVTYRPSTDLTAFVSYKRGYKGPGFNVSCNPSCAPAFNALPPVEPVFGEKAEGFEAGVKAALLDRRLQLVASAYGYNYKNLQVSYVVLQPSGALAVRLANGADAKVQGVELGADYEVFDGFKVSAFGNYNDSHYTSFNAAPCYGGQTAAQGCVNGAAQDLKGRTLEGASKWSGVLGFDYARMLGGDREIRLSTTARYSSRYFAETDRNPNSIQKGYAIVDAALHYGPENGGWDMALIGRNLTDKHYITVSSGSGTVTPGLVEDVFGYTNRGRQIMVQASAKF